MTMAHDVPLLHGSLAIRNPRNVLLLNPFQLPIVVALFALSIVFMIWPELLEHAPVGFEKRGVVHHAWHYMLLGSSGLILWGMFSAGRLRLKLELIGLVVLAGVIAIHLTAVISDAASAGTTLPGFSVALRTGLLFGCVFRAYIVAREPTVIFTSEDIQPAGGEDQ